MCPFQQPKNASVEPLPCSPRGLLAAKKSHSAAYEPHEIRHYSRCVRIASMHRKRSTRIIFHERPAPRYGAGWQKAGRILRVMTKSCVSSLFPSAAAPPSSSHVFTVNILYYYIVPAVSRERSEKMSSSSGRVKQPSELKSFFKRIRSKKGNRVREEGRRRRRRLDVRGSERERERDDIKSTVLSLRFY